VAAGYDDPDGGEDDDDAPDNEMMFGADGDLGATSDQVVVCGSSCLVSQDDGRICSSIIDVWSVHTSH
jgi:hypothetical protein